MALAGVAQPSEPSTVWRLSLSRGAWPAGFPAPVDAGPARSERGRHRAGPGRITAGGYCSRRGWRFHGPVMASMMPGVWMLAKSVLPSGEKVTPVNSLYSGSASV